MSAAGIAVLAHLIDLLSIFLRYSGFARIQKAVVDQTGSRCPTLRTRAGAKLGEWAGTGGREHPQRVARGGCEPGSW